MNKKDILKSAGWGAATLAILWTNLVVLSISGVAGAALAAAWITALAIYIKKGGRNERAVMSAGVGGSVAIAAVGIIIAGVLLTTDTGDEPRASTAAPISTSPPPAPVVSTNRGIAIVDQSAQPAPQRTPRPAFRIPNRLATASKDSLEEQSAQWRQRSLYRAAWLEQGHRNREIG